MLRLNRLYRYALRCLDRARCPTTSAGTRRSGHAAYRPCRVDGDCGARGTSWFKKTVHFMQGWNGFAVMRMHLRWVVLTAVLRTIMTLLHEPTPLDMFDNGSRFLVALRLSASSHHH